MLRCRRGSSSRRRRLSIPTRLCCFPQASAVLRPLVVSLLLCSSAPLFRSSPLYRSPLHLSTTCVCVCVCVRVLCPSLHPSLLSSQPPSSNHCTMALAFRTAIFRATRMVVAPGARFASTEHRTCLSLSLARDALLDPPRSQHALAALRCSSTHPCSSNRSCTRVLVGETARALSLSLLVRVSLCPRVLPTPSPNSTAHTCYHCYC